MEAVASLGLIVVVFIGVFVVGFVVKEYFS